MRKTMIGAVLAGAALLLSGCIPLATAIPAGIGLYCAGVSEAGKHAVRGAATGGVQLIHCDRPGAPR